MSAISPDYEWPNCWIRGEISISEIESDAVMKATQACPFRSGKPSKSLFSDTDYVCTHSAIRSKEDVEGAKIKYGGLMVGGGVDDFKTFCVPVDMHLTSLGEPSALVIEGQSRFVEESLQLPLSWRTYIAGLLGSGQK